MTKYIIKRILIAIPVLLGITVIDYAIMCMAGSPLEMLQGPRVSEAAVQAKAIALGLDKPFYVQYFVWLGQLLHGNMGYSIKNYQPVAAMITSHLGPTLLLMGVSLLVSILLQIGLLLPGIEGWEGQVAMETVFGAVPRILAASFAAFLAGSMVNAWVMSRMKRRAEERGRGSFSLRAIVSTLWGEGVDSLVFFPIAFAGVVDASTLIGLMVSQALLKTAYEVAVLPLTRIVVRRLKTIEAVTPAA